MLVGGWGEENVKEESLERKRGKVDNIIFCNFLFNVIFIDFLYIS